MQYSLLSGKICNVPEISILPIDVDKQVYICKFVVCTVRGCEPDGNQLYDFFQCVAFDNIARMVSERFNKGVRVVVFGKFNNHRFKDANNTNHFSDILLVEHIEFGDMVTLPYVRNATAKDLEKPLVSEIKMMDEFFEQALKNGFMCLDEDDYYDIAAANMDYKV